MTLNAEQIREATQTWQARVGSGVARGDECLGDGPYRILVAVNTRAGQQKWGVREAFTDFGGVSIPCLNPIMDTDEVRPSQRSLLVLPRMVYSSLMAYTGRDVADATLEPKPSWTPPQEGDLADIFITAMSRVTPRHPSYFTHCKHLGPTVRSACEHLGWRTVATMVNTLTEGTPRSPHEVAAALGALTSPPARMG